MVHTLKKININITFEGLNSTRRNQIRNGQFILNISPYKWMEFDGRYKIDMVREIFPNKIIKGIKE